MNTSRHHTKRQDLRCTLNKPCTVMSGPAHTSTSASIGRFAKALSIMHMTTRISLHLIRGEGVDRVLGVQKDERLDMSESERQTDADAVDCEEQRRGPLRWSQLRGEHRLSAWTEGRQARYAW